MLLRREQFHGRHKLADKYSDTPFVVTGVNPEEDVYEIRPSGGGGAKWVNRRRLVKDPRDYVDEMLDESEESLPEENESQQEHGDISSDEDSTDEENEFWSPFRTLTVPRPARRSARRGRGTHGNIHRLPTSVKSVFTRT